MDNLLSFSWKHFFKVPKVQARCSSAALPSDYITPPVALVQHCSSTEEQWGSSICSREAEEHSLACRLHNTTTLHLTSVRSSVRTSVRSQSTSQSKKLVNLHVIQPSIAYHNILHHVLTENNAVEHSTI